MGGNPPQYLVLRTAAKTCHGTRNCVLDLERHSSKVVHTRPKEAREIERYCEKMVSSRSAVFVMPCFSLAVADKRCGGHDGCNCG